MWTNAKQREPRRLNGRYLVALLAASGCKKDKPEGLAPAGDWSASPNALPNVGAPNTGGNPHGGANPHGNMCAAGTTSRSR